MAQLNTVQRLKVYELLKDELELHIDFPFNRKLKGNGGLVNVGLCHLLWGINASYDICEFPELYELKPLKSKYGQYWFKPGIIKSRLKLVYKAIKKAKETLLEEQFFGTLK